MAIADLKAFTKKVGQSSKLPTELKEQIVMSIAQTVIGSGPIKNVAMFKAELMKFLAKVESEMKKG